MKLNIVQDAHGKVVATFEKPGRAGGAEVKPELKPGLVVREVDAQENYLTDLDTFYKQHSKA